MIVLVPVITDVLGVLLSSPLTSGGIPDRVVTGFAVTGVVSVRTCLGGDRIGL